MDDPIRMDDGTRGTPILGNLHMMIYNYQKTGLPSGNQRWQVDAIGNTLL